MKITSTRPGACNFIWISKPLTLKSALRQRRAPERCIKSFRVKVMFYEIYFTLMKKKIQDGKEILNLSEQQPQLCFFIYLIFFLPKSAYIFSESMIYLSTGLRKYPALTFTLIRVKDWCRFSHQQSVQLITGGKVFFFFIQTSDFPFFNWDILVF